jgi:biotin carboxyl carrier protein
MSRYLAKVDGKVFDVKVDRATEGFSFLINGKTKSVKAEILGGTRILILIDNQPSEIEIRANGYEAKRVVFVKGAEIEVEIEDYRLAQAKRVAGMGNAENAIKTVKAPMPGLILEIMIGVGEKANRNQPLVVIEAMKMENIIKSPVNASVKRILTSRGKSVEKNDLLIEFE